MNLIAAGLAPLDPERAESRVPLRALWERKAREIAVIAVLGREGADPVVRDIPHSSRSRAHTGNGSQRSGRGWLPFPAGGT